MLRNTMSTIEFLVDTVSIKVRQRNTLITAICKREA